MFLNTVFNIISVILQQPVHLSMLTWSAFYQFFEQYSFQATDCFPNTINPWKQYWLSWDWQSPVLESCKLLTELCLMTLVRDININPIPDYKIFDWSKLKQIADSILKCIQNEK